MMSTRNEKLKSSWERRKEYSKKICMSLNRSLSVIKQKRPSPVEPEKSGPMSKVNTCKNMLLGPVTKKPSEISKATVNKPTVVSKAKMVPKYQPKTQHTRNLEKKPQLAGQNFVSNAQKTKETKRPFSTRGNLLNATKDPPAKRIRRGSFTISTGAENEKTGNLDKKPKKTKQNDALSKVLKQTNIHQKVVPFHTKENVARTLGKKRPLTNMGSNDSNANKIVPAKRIRRRSFTVGTGKENEKTENARVSKSTAKMNKTTKVNNRPTINKPSGPKRPEDKEKKVMTRAKKETAVCETKTPGAETKKPVAQQRKRVTIHDAAKEAEELSQKISRAKLLQKKAATPLVRLPVGERLALWRERKEEAENKRRETVSALTDLLNASRHKRCFVTDVPCSCPSAINKIKSKKDLTKKRNFNCTKEDHPVQDDTKNMPSSPNEPGHSHVNIQEEICVVDLKSSLVIDEEKLPTQNNSVLVHVDVHQELLELKSSLVNGSSLDDIQNKLITLKIRAPDVERNAHYWEILAMIAQKDGDMNEAYRIYEAATLNEAEPMEVIKESLEKFLVVLNETTKPQPNAAGRMLKDDSKSGKKKRISVNQKNVFESTLIQYAMQKYSPFVTKLGEDLNMDSPPLGEYIIPVRRSARLCKSAKRDAQKAQGIRTKDKFIFNMKTNKALKFND